MNTDRARRINPDHRLLSVTEAADVLGVSNATLYRLIRRGDLSGTRVTPRRWRFTLADIDACITKLRADIRRDP